MKDCRYANNPFECIFDDDNCAWTCVTSCKHFRKHIFCKYYKSLKDLESGGSGSVIERK
jgi:uncharacterized protein YfeS